MGDPKKSRRKYSRPHHPWKKDRIDGEKKVLKAYGLKNKREIWQMAAFLRSISDQAKKLIASRGVQADKERELFLARLVRQGLMGAGAKLDDVLGISLDNVLERRLQTLVVRKGLAKSMNQARQFIAHNHVLVNNKIITRPSYLVSSDEEHKMGFHAMSALNNPEHPVRAQSSQQQKPEASKESGKESGKKGDAQ